MEIKLNDVNLKYKNKYLIKNLNLEIPCNEIIGIINDKYNIIKKILVDKYEIEGSISKNDFTISYINNRIFLTKTVSDEFYLIKKNIKDYDNYIEKIVSSVKMVGLDENYLERNIYSLSKTEKILVEIALSLVTNPDIVIFDNVFKNLDKKNKLILKKIILELKRNYHKTIIIVDDINVTYEICNYFVIFKDDYLLISGDRSYVFDDLDLLIDNIELPFFLKFKIISKNYNEEIENYTNIDDLLKGVYKNAR